VALVMLSMSWSSAFAQSATEHGDAPLEETLHGDAAERSTEERAPTALELLELSDEILQDIERLRGVYSTGPIDRSVANRETLRLRLGEIISREYADWEIRDMERLMRALDILPREQGYLDTLLNLLEDEVAGFYDHDARVFYIMEEGDPATQPTVISHELFHAIQDQVWGISSIQGRTKRISDAALAISGLVEGDAVAVMTEYTESGSIDRFAQMPRLLSIMETLTTTFVATSTEDVPSMMWDQLVYPYVTGLRFVVAVYAHGGWEAVNRVYEDPPISTEQVIYPDRYINRDMPTWLIFEMPPLSNDMRRYTLDIVGQFSLQALIRQNVDGLTVTDARGMVRGWDGDRLEAYEFFDDEDRDLVVHLSVWDTLEDAQTFANAARALSRTWMGRSMESGGEGAHGEAWLVDDALGIYYVERWGDMVLWILDRGGEIDPVRRRNMALYVAERVWETHERSQYPSLRNESP